MLSAFDLLIGLLGLLGFYLDFLLWLSNSHAIPFLLAYRLVTLTLLLLHRCGGGCHARATVVQQLPEASVTTVENEKKRKKKGGDGWATIEFGGVGCPRSVPL